MRLAVVLDPLDALLTTGPEACAGLVAAAAALAAGGRTWVIGVVGTARLGHLAPLLPLLALSDGLGSPGLDPDTWYHLEAPAPGRVRQVVEIPAGVAGVEVEGHAPGDRRSLVDLLEAEAGTLRHWPPLVEAALDLAYRSAAERARTQPHGPRGATLTRADYQAVGGIAGVALARAEAVWAGLDAGVRSALPVLCRALVSLDGARPALRSGDLRVLEADPACRALVAALVEVRLVAVDAERDPLTRSPCPQADYSLLGEVRETLRQTWAEWRARLRPKRAAAALTAELAEDSTAAAAASATSQSGPGAEPGPVVPDDLTDWAAWRAGASFTHPVLLTGWPPVRDWLARSDNRQTLQLRHQIGRRAQLWRRTDCNREYLLGAAGYPAAKALAGTLAGEIEPLEADYLAQSALYLGLQHRRSQALRAIGASLLVLLALATLAALWALDASRFARVQLHRSELAAAATDIAKGNSPRALMRALAAAPALPQEASNTVSRILTENRLIAMAQGPQDAAPGPEGRPISPAFRDDGERLITATPTEGVSLWRLDEGRFELEGPLADPGLDLRMLAFVGKGDASRVLAGGPGGVWLLPAGPGAAPDYPCAMDFGSVVALDPNGRHVAVAQALGQTEGEGASAGTQAAGYGVCIIDLDRRRTALRIPDPDNPEAGPLHKREILGLDFSPDGQRLATASADGSAKVIDLASGEPILTLPPEGRLRRGINRAVFDPVDGGRIGLACADERVRVYRTDGTLIANLGEIQEGGVTIRLHTSGVHDLDFARDGRYLVAGDDDGQVVRWDLTRAGSAQILGQHRLAVTQVRVAPAHGDADAEPVALTASDDRSARLWGVYTGRELAAFSHDAAVTDALLSTDGSRVMTFADRDGSARLWGVRRISRIGHRMTQTDHVGSVAVSPDATVSEGQSNNPASDGADATGRRPLVFAIGSHDGSIGVWHQDGATPAVPPQRMRLLTGHSGRVRRVGFSPSGRWLASASYDGTARVWDPRTGAGCTMDAVVSTPETGSGNAAAVPEVYRALFGPDEDWVLTASNDPIPVRLWGWDGHTCVPQDPDPAFAHGSARVQAAAVGRDREGAQIVATGDEAGQVRVMRRRPGLGWERLCDLDAHKGHILDIALSPDGTRLASAGKDGNIRLVRLLAQDCALQAPLTGHRSQVNALSFAPDGASLVSAGQDGIARVWGSDGTPLAKLLGHRERVSIVEFSPDGHWILTGSRDGDLRLWPAPTRHVGTLDGSWLTLGAGHRTVASAVFTPDGKGLVAGYWGNAAYLWRLWSEDAPDQTLVATWGAQRAGLTLIQEADRFRRENHLDLRHSSPGEAP